jgi:glutamine amidotransferase-like uncharacterized protein
LAQIAERSGFRVQYVGPDEADLDIFQRAKLWIQPGGRALTQARKMSPALKLRIIEFVKQGGSYVGICAGAFLAAEQFGWGGAPGRKVLERGLGLIPGFSGLYSPAGNENVLLMNSDWLGFGKRELYWELGPDFRGESLWGSSVEVLSRYPEGLPATVRSTFGKGRVYVTAFHPEAPQAWRDYYQLKDSDGVDFDLVTEMIRWTTSLVP